MATETKRALIRGEVSIAEIITVTVRAIEGLQAPFKITGSGMTVAVPVLGSATLAFKGFRRDPFTTLTL